MKNRFALLALAGVMVLALAACRAENPSDKDAASDDVCSAENSGVEMMDSIDRALTDTLAAQGYTIEHASAIQEVLNAVGIAEIEIESMTGDAERGLNAVVCLPNGETDKEKRFHFTTEDGVLFYAGFSGEDLYDSERGGFLKSYSDVSVPEKTVSLDVYEDLRTLAEEEVKSRLNYPQTADFSMLDWGVGRSDDQYQIVGSVTAKNGAGVKSEVAFSVWFVRTESGFATEGVAFDGKMVS